MSSVSVAMLDIKSLSQLLTEHARRQDVATQVELTPSSGDQRPFADWYGRNWMSAQQPGVQGVVGDRLDMSKFLSRYAPSVAVDRMPDDGLGVASFHDLSGGLHVMTQPTTIMLDGGGGKACKGLRIELKAVELFKLSGLALPLVSVAHSRTHDFWLAMPNQPLDRAGDFDLFQFATNAMAQKRKIYDAADTWSHVEIPEVAATVRRSLEWLKGLRLNGDTIQQVLQVCKLEINKGNVWSVRGPRIASETLQGPPPICFDQGFVVWAAHYGGKLVSPVMRVPSSLWVKA